MSTSHLEFQGHRVVELRSESARALVSPEAGGRLLEWSIHGHSLIYWPDHPDWSLPAKIRGGNPLLFPFLGRHFVDGVIDQWRDATGTVRPMPMHGFARTSSFTLLDASTSNSAVMELTPTPATLAFYPHDFRFRVIYEIGPTKLTVRFETENRSSVPMPYYSGHHFYFALPAEERPQWTLHMAGVEQARQNSDGSIGRTGTTQTSFTLNDPGLQDTFHVLLGKGNPVLRHPDGRGLEFDLDAAGARWHAVTTWTEKPDSPFYCIEPWLGLPNAIHHGEGLRHVMPGATESAICSLRASGW